MPADSCEGVLSIEGRAIACLYYNLVYSVVHSCPLPHGCLLSWVLALEWLKGSCLKLLAIDISCCCRASHSVASFPLFVVRLTLPSTVLVQCGLFRSDQVDDRGGSHQKRNTRHNNSYIVVYTSSFQSQVPGPR